MQLRTSKTIRFFDVMLRQKFGFKEYTLADKPAVFFGVYGKEDVDAVLAHTGPKVIWYAGTDSTYKNLLEAIKLSLNEQTIVNAESKWIEKDLGEAGINFKTMSIFLDNFWSWKPVEHGTAIYWYGGGNSKYGKQYVEIVQAAFPDTEIIIADHGTFPREQMPDVYAKCFCVIRMTEHDGLSQGVAEAALMGRMSIWNGTGPFALGYKDVNDVIEHIRALKQGYNYRLTAKRARLYFFENERKWADTIMELCGLDGIDYSGILHEDSKRCGSIFRIQRKSDIEKIGGLGTEQFERPWFAGKMQELGKKQLVTSKSSGWGAKEWKGAGNKGYPKGTEFHTYDKKYE